MRPIPGLDGYFASEDGSIWTDRRGQLRKRIPWEGKGGYLVLNLQIALGVRKEFRVHRLIAETFLGLCPDGKETRHLDGNKKNNSLDNLVWGTKKENGRDSARLGVTRGSKNGRARLTESQVRTIKSINKTYQELADQFDVSLATIGMIRTGRNWGHLI